MATGRYSRTTCHMPGLPESLVRREGLGPGGLQQRPTLGIGVVVDGRIRSPWRTGPKACASA